MPLTPLTAAQLSSFQQELHEEKTDTSESFAKLRHLYESFSQNVEDLAILEYSSSLINAEDTYNELKGTCKTAYQSLKHKQKQLDERILAIEQKLYLGLPEDLAEMEKVILEQESIVADQEEINQMEEELLEKMRKIDIDHGKQLAGLEQSNLNRSLPLKSKLEAFQLKIDAEEKQMKFKTRLFTLAPILIIPILLDLLAVKTGIQKTSGNDFILSHYVFFLVFLALEIFFAEKIKHFVSSRVSKSSCLLLLSDLEKAFTENQRDIRKIQEG